MNRLLRSDLYKQQRSTTLKACLILAFLIGIIMAVLYNIAANQLHANYDQYVNILVDRGINQASVEDIFSEMPEYNLWAYINISLSDNNVLYFGAIIISVLVGSEYSMGTLRNSVSRGYSRDSVFFSKLITSVLSMYAVVLFYVLGSGITAFVMYGFGSSIGAGKILLIILAYLLLYAAVSCFYMMVAVMMKSTGHALGFSIIVPLLVATVMRLAAMAEPGFDSVSRWWIFNTIEATQKMCLSSDVWIPFAVAAVYFSVSCIAGLFFLRRQEIK